MNVKTFALFYLLPPAVAGDALFRAIQENDLAKFAAGLGAMLVWGGIVMYCHGPGSLQRQQARDFAKHQRKLAKIRAKHELSLARADTKRARNDALGIPN